MLSSELDQWNNKYIPLIQIVEETPIFNRIYIIQLMLSSDTAVYPVGRVSSGFGHHQ